MSNAPTKQDTRPLGYIALGAAVLSGLLAVSYFLSVLAFLPGVVALFVGGAARGLPTTRRAGTAAMAIAVAAMAIAAFVLVTLD